MEKRTIRSPNVYSMALSTTTESGEIKKGIDISIIKSSKSRR
jgi:hypothetical protein